MKKRRKLKRSETYATINALRAFLDKEPIRQCGVRKPTETPVEAAFFRTLGDGNRWLRAGKDKGK